jgi:hypothetical protein
MAESPSYDGRGLVNLVAELEFRLIGSAPSPRLADPGLVPEADTYVVVLFDGLGMAQMGHREAGALRSSLQGSLEAPFPTTTSVSLATVATGLAPSRHGLVAHLIWLEEVGQVVNSLKWVDLAGGPVDYPYQRLLPEPNLWERLRGAGVEPITVQPGEFDRTPLSQALYRGSRFEGVWDTAEMVKATLQMASAPGRLVFTYFPPVDFAGHVFGLDSEEFSRSIEEAGDLWERISAGLPSGAALLGTADHGLAPFPEENKRLLRGQEYSGLRFAGDSRGIQMWGDRAEMERIAEETGSELADPVGLVGPQPTPTTLARLGERVLLPPDHLAVIPKGFDKRLASYHGGLSRAEVEIPLLVG